MTGSLAMVIIDHRGWLNVLDLSKSVSEFIYCFSNLSYTLVLGKTQLSVTSDCSACR
jgi:hypothetical protein